jgi:hypothetical protein
MDSQTNALYDNPSFAKLGLSELSFNANGQGKKKAGNSQATTPTGRKFVVLPADSMEAKKALESSASPFLSPSSSFVKSRQHHSMKSLKLGKKNTRKFEETPKNLKNSQAIRWVSLVPT